MIYVILKKVVVNWRAIFHEIIEEKDIQKSAQ